MLSRRARYAIAAMLDVARLARGGPLPARMLTTQEGMAPRQFETVLQDLVRAGLLRSVRGPHGGYELARERRRIAVGAIVRAVEPALGGSDGTAGQDGIELLITQATAAFLAHLDSVSIDELGRRTETPGAPLDADFHI